MNATQGMKGSGAKNRQTQKSGTSASCKPVLFEIEAPQDSEIFLAGSFNNWDPAARRLKMNGNGKFATRVNLPAGRHEFKFVINGAWQADPDCPQWVPNEHGSLNSVVDVM